MKRSVLVGVVCLLVGFLLNGFLFQMRSLFGSSADALTGSAFSLRKGGGQELESFGAAAQAEMAPAPSVAASMAPEELAAPDVGFDGLAKRGGALAGGAGGGAPSSKLRSVLKAEPGVPSLDEAPEPPGRAWFPETFLFEPLVVTDASGQATVPVRVPDRLTQWRVLALAHSRSGAQAGAVSTFAGTLPTYVDPVLPPFLRAGDVARVPVQVVNTTDAPLTRALKVEAEGAVVENGSRTVTVPAGDSVVEYVTLRVGPPGPVTVRASLGGTDSVERVLDVWPTGRPETRTWGSSLATSRSRELVGPEQAQAGSERVRLLVFPGALGLVRAELAAAPAREGVADDAYALLLAGRAPALLTALGGPVEPAALERMTALTLQRVLGKSRQPDVATAALLAEAALMHPGNPVLARLGERLAAQVAQAQRPDGTCQGQDGWTVQRLLVATADCVRAVRAGSATEAGGRRASAFGARAAGAFERHLSRIQDGYTAAAVLASGGVSGSVRDQLRGQVLAALASRPEGVTVLPVAPGVVRADGRVPSEVEATALAVLALGDEPKAPRAELGTALLAGYRPESGWGDGRANLAGLLAALALFQQPLPAEVRVVLERDGQRVTEGVFDATMLREVRALEMAAPGSGGPHTWTVRAEPAVPGLGFSLTLSAFVPWRMSAAGGGLELAVTSPEKARVGQPAEVVVQAASPAGLPLILRQELPAGVQVDRPSLEALVQERRLAAFDVEDGAVRLYLPPRKAGEPFLARYRVIPTLAGTLQAGATRLTATNNTVEAFHVPPTTWTIQ